MKKIICFLGNKLLNLKNKRLDKKNIRKILIIRFNGLGDVVMTTPLIRELRKIFPKIKIDYLTSNGGKEILKNNPYLDEVLGVDTQNFYSNNIQRLKDLIKLRKLIVNRRYDLCFILEYLYSAQIYLSSFKIPIKIGPDRLGEGFVLDYGVPYLGNQSEIKSYLSCLNFFKYQSKNTQTKIFLNSSEKKLASNFIKENNLSSKKIIGISSGGAKNDKEEAFIKRWPIKNYKSLCKKLVEKGFVVILFGDKYDKKITQEISSHVKSKNCINLAGRFNLRKSIALMTKCNVFVTHDSGPMHIASALGIPTIAFFGPTPKVRFGLLNNKSMSIECGKPCYDIYGNFSCKNYSWDKKIDADYTYKNIRRILKK